jgi:hypothetical protein
MTQQYKTKSEVKASTQNVDAQDNPQSISITDGLTRFYETRSAFYENAFLAVDQQAAKDVMGKFLEFDRTQKNAIGGLFLTNLSNTRQISLQTFGLLPMLSMSADVDADCERNDYLVEKQNREGLNDTEMAELAELQARLEQAGLIE